MSDEQRMNADIKAEWREGLATATQFTGGALRGTPYVPSELYGAEELTVTGYCCWGVLCEVLVRRGFLVHADADGGYRLANPDDTPDEETRGLSFWSYPSNAVLTYCEIPFYVNGADSTIGLLAGMNDEGSNFNAISAVIDELL